jgi:hypothetical protein
MLDTGIPSGASQIATFCGFDIELYLHSSWMKRNESEGRAIYAGLLIHPNWAFCRRGARDYSGQSGFQSSMSPFDSLNFS